MYNRLEKRSVYMGLSLSKQSLRLGELRTFLYTYVLGRKNNLAVYIRIDDTNPDNHNLLFLDQILKELKQFEIHFCEQELSYWYNDLLFQSKQKDIYKYFLGQLRQLGVLSEHEGLVSVDINKVIKSFVHNSIKIGKDILRRKTEFSIEKCGYKYIPLYIVKDDRFLFHLPCVVDEYLMNTSVAIRGEDKMPLMPMHDILRDLLGFPLVEYLYLPLLLMPDSTKRLKGAEYSLEALLKIFNKEKICNYLIKSGYNATLTKNIGTQEFIEMFDVYKIKKQSSHVNLKEI